jgi:hypothetical protein
MLAVPAALALLAASAPFVLATDDGVHEVQPQLMLQLRSELAADALGLDEAGPALLIRRARPGVHLRLFERGLALHLQLEMRPGRLEVIDAFLDVAVPLPGAWGPAAGLRLRGGVLILPLTWYRSQGWFRTTLSEWALVTRHLGAERQLGAELYREPSASLPFEARLGVFSGEDLRGAHAVALMHDVYGLPPSPLRTSLVDLAPPPRLHPELAFRLGWFAGPTEQRLTHRGGAPRGFLALSGALDLSPKRGWDHAARIAPELLVQGHGLTAHLLTFATTFAAPSMTGLASVGAFGQLAWRVRGPLELATHVTWAHYTDAVLRDARAFAAERGEAMGALRTQGEVAAGLNLDLFQGVRLQADAAVVPELREDRGWSSGARGRTQLSFVF